MSTQTVQIYPSGDTLPQLLEGDFFHSRELFSLCRQTPRQKPYMVTVEDESGCVQAQMLAVVRYRTSWLPPYLYRHCRVLGEGCYQTSDRHEREHLFGLMLEHFTKRIGRYLLYVEVSNLSHKMLGYRQFREQGYFPVRWMSIHNSLHSRTPEERISQRMQRRIEVAYERGVVTDEVQGDDDFKAFSKLLRHHNWLKPKRYIPADEFFKGLQQQGHGRLYLTRYRGHIVGCSAVVYSQQQAYLWYAAYRRKSFALIHPDVLTIWHAIKDSHRQSCEHIFFLDVGLPFRKNSFREFILRFGGKPQSTYRWFRCSIRWINRLLSWIYRE